MKMLHVCFHGFESFSIYRTFDNFYKFWPFFDDLFRSKKIVTNTYSNQLIKQTHFQHLTVHMLQNSSCASSFYQGFDQDWCSLHWLLWFVIWTEKRQSELFLFQITKRPDLVNW